MYRKFEKNAKENGELLLLFELKAVYIYIGVSRKKSSLKLQNQEQNGNGK